VGGVDDRHELDPGGKLLPLAASAPLAACAPWAAVIPITVAVRRAGTGARPYPTRSRSAAIRSCGVVRQTAQPRTCRKIRLRQSALGLRSQPAVVRPS
jgi:hypothetical protein